MSVEAKGSLLKSLIASGRLSPARILTKDEFTWKASRRIVAGIEGCATIEGQEVRLRVGLCERFPFALPQVFLVHPDGFGTLPHIERDGRICYRPDDGLLIDYRLPHQVIEEAIEAAIKTVEAGLSGVNWDDFHDELEAYWAQMSETRHCPCHVEPDDMLRRIDVARSVRNKIGLIADSWRDVEVFFGGVPLKSAPLRTGYYVPLADSVLSERFNPRQFDSLEWVRSFVSRHISRANHAALRRLGAKNYQNALLVLGIPMRKGGKALIGLDYEGVTGGNPLLQGHTKRPMRPIAMERRDRAVVTIRAEGALDMSKKRVALVGCGAIGGHLAILLARAGVGNLTLIDPDTFSAQNAFRHALGSAAIGMRKVDALKQEIKAKVPYTNVSLARRYLDDALACGELGLQNIDLLIYAAGDPTAGLYLNEHLHDQPKSPACLYTWLEPYGIGGHALLTNTHVPGVRGCFGCLFGSAGVGEPRRNRSDFAGPDQYFAKDVSGCGTRYTPYADLDAVRTAELATRLALDFLRGRAEGHPLLSWKGDNDAFCAAGFRTATRYDLDQQSLTDQRFKYELQGCVYCGSRS